MHDQIENIYSLTPLQQGLLAHEASQPESRAYYQQWRSRLRGQIDRTAFATAWRALMKRHAVLRTAVLWEDLDDAYQVVLRDVALPLRELDLRGQLRGGEQALETAADEDLAAFDLGRAPLMRLTLARQDDSADSESQWTLLWTFHHIVLDGWSVGLVLADWRELYTAALEGRDAALPAPAPFHDHVAHAVAHPLDEAFWRAQLGDVEAATPLPQLDGVVPAPDGLPVAEHLHRLTADDTARLVAFCRAQGLTLNTLLQGAYAHLLGLHAGRDEALIGITVAGRAQALAGSDQMVGLFINTLPLRVRWAPQASVGEWLAQLQQLNAQLRDHEHTPLARLRAFTALPPGAPLFEALLVFENFPFPRELDRIAPGLVALLDAQEHAPLRHTHGRNNLPMSLIASLEAETLELRLVHQRRRLSDNAGAELLRQLVALMTALARDATRPLSALPLTTLADEALLRAWGDGVQVPVPDMPLHALIGAQEARHPEREAVRDAGGALSYGVLWAQAGALATRLLAGGLQAGEPVAIALPRSNAAVVAILGVLRAGGCFLPLDLSQPALRLSAVVRASQARWIVGTPSFDTGSAQVIAPHGDEVAPAGALPQVSPDAPAYLIYTSGSTGTPKGVLLPHRAIVTYVCGIVHALGLHEGEPWRHALLSTIAADLGYTQLFGSLASGGSLLLVDDDTRADPQSLARCFAAHRPDLVKLTPSHLQGLLSARRDADLLPRRALLLGGEALPGTLVAAVHELSPQLAVYNHYGPTETAVGVTLQRIDAPHPGVQPLGRPQPNRQLRVLDAHGRLLPAGMPGELFIGGEGLATAYLGDAVQTDQRFTPAADLPRAYRTGDRLRWLASGQLAFLGRVDHQVKLRGYRIELAEVEAQVRALSPRLQQVLVRLVQPEGEAPRLVCWFVADTSMSADKLRDDLAQRVPEAMVPAAFVSLDAIPLTANGKPDVARLPLPDAKADARHGYVAPRNPTEALLAQIWQDVLHVERAGIHDDFFALGGDSILSLQIIARAHQQGLKLTPKQLFEQRSIAQLAHAAGGAVAVSAREARQPVPWTAGQRERLEAGPVVPTWRGVEVAAAPTIDALTQALQALQRHHRALQFGLERDAQGRWTPWALDAPRLASISVLDDQPTDWPELARQRFDALDHAAGEGLHAVWVPSTKALLLVSHPLRLDDQAWDRLLDDLSLALAQALHDRPIELSAHGGDPADFAAWQQRLADSDTLEPAWEYWLQHAGDDVPALAGETEACSLPVPGELHQALHELRQRSHTSWTTLLGAALAAEAAAASNHDAVWISLPAGRAERRRVSLNEPLSQTPFDPSRIIGALSHATPLRISVARGAEPAALLASVDAQLAAAPQGGDHYGLLCHLSGNAFLREPLLQLPAPQFGVRVEHNVAGHGPIVRTVAADAPAPLAPLQLTLRIEQEGASLRCEGPQASLWATRALQRLQQFADVASIARPGSQAFPLCSAADLATLGQDAAFDFARIEDLYPLSPMQEGMLLHTLLKPDSGIYLMQQRYQWEGALERDPIEAAWRTLLARHPALRTGFWWQDGRPPLQCVFRETDAGFAWYDWRGMDEAAQRQQLEAVLAAERRQGFDLRRSPLTRLRVFRLAERHHVMVRSFHHILNDAWCFGLLMSDLFTHYREQVMGEWPTRPAAPAYREFIHWLKRHDPAATEAFWRRELQGLAAPTPLVVDRPVPPNHAVEDVGNVDANLSVAETRALDALCREHRLTPNTWIQGAWALLLARYSGLHDVMFGITVAGRPTELPEVERTVGLFINSLPLRVQVDETQPVLPWLQALLAHNLALREHEHTPLVQIQRCSDIAAPQPLFESLVVFENAPFDAGLADRRLDFDIDIAEDRVHTNYAMTVVLYPGDRLGIRLSYDRARFDDGAVERMLMHLRELVAQMIARPEVCLADVPMLGAAERQALLVDCNRSEQPFPLEHGYAALFAEQVARTPQRVAAVCGDHALSYADLDQRSSRLAQALVAAGAQRDTLVALAGERGLPLLTMMLAVFKAGAAYLPLDVNHPPQRIAQLLDLAAPSLVLASAQGLPVLDRALTQTAAQPRVLRAEALWQPGDAVADLAGSGPGDLAYVIFTSGSTGRPKGAMVEQRGMLNNIFGKQPSLGLSADDRIAQTASPAFDISVWQFLAAPLFGATVHILPDEVSRDPARLLQALQQQQITVLEAVPAMIRALLDACTPDTQLPQLRWLLPTGEALPPALARAWLQRFPQVPLMNAYGPAECSDDVAFHPITEPPAGDEPVPIGRPTPNNRLYLLDPTLRPVPVGVAGEICVGGVGVGRGYLHDPERTQAAFIEHSLEPGARLYRTGDLGRRRADGVIEFLGRRDQQVKVRGHRIELGEIEDRLGEHPAVQAVAVIARPDAQGQTQLAAYWVAGAECNGDALRDWLAGRLPGAMVPAHFVQLHALPLNANGKVDRLALAAREIEAPQRSGVVRPATETERWLAAQWCALLGLPAVSADDHFFALGGHSLLATQVVSRIRGHWQAELPLRVVFEHPTLHGLAAAIDAARERPAAATLPPLQVQARPERLPLSFAQQRLWFLEQLQPGSAEFHIPFALVLDGPLDREALRHGFESLIERHAALRSTVHSDEGEPWQRVEPVAAFELPCVPLLGEDEQSPAMRERLQRLMRQPFDLARTPLLRAELLQLGPQRHLLALVIHHIAADAWSIALLVDNLAEAYRSHTEGRAPRFEPAPLQYADFALWQRRHLAPAAWQTQLAYWRGQLAAPPAPLVLPGARVVPHGARQAARRRRHLPLALVQALNRQAEARQASLFMLLHAALSVLLHQQTGRRDLLVGADVANRNHAGTEGLVGFFVNQIVLRSRVEPEQRFDELLAACRETALAAFQHQDLPFDHLVAELLPQRDPRHTPFFQVKLVLQNALQRTLALPGLAIDELELPPQEAELDLLVNAIEDEQGLLLVYDHDASRYPAEVITALDTAFTALLEAVAADARQPVAELARRVQAPATAARSARESTLGQVRRRSATANPVLP